MGVKLLQVKHLETFQKQSLTNWPKEQTQSTIRLFKEKQIKTKIANRKAPGKLQMVF